jgi:hypothetical protein
MHEHLRVRQAESLARGAAQSRNWPMLAARPIASVLTSLGIRRIVS